MLRFSGSPRFCRVCARLVAPLLLVLVALALFPHGARAQSLTAVDIPGPAGSGSFGGGITILPNGNFVVVDPLYDAPGAVDAGAVSLYDGVTLTRISRLTGSSANDQVGNGGIFVLSNGNFVVSSWQWNNGAATSAGAATWVNAATGLDSEVSAANSLVGSTTNDLVSSGGITALTNGNYVVASWQWGSPPLLNVGAATWGDGATGTVGVVSAANSLVGSAAGDQVSEDGVTALPNGNYVVGSRSWRNETLANAGAVTWVNGASAFAGAVSATNSMVGGAIGDSLGSGGVVVLPQGNLLVRSPLWNSDSANDAGALTWVNGATGRFGLLSDANSLIGLSVNDQIGANDVTVLTNGNYVVVSLGWDNGAVADAGAVTWGDGAAGTFGEVDVTNSLVGSEAGDLIGNGGIVPLTNGNYVVVSPDDDLLGAATDTGAVTWGDGESGVFGVVGNGNSLVGGSQFDQVGSEGVVALTNGNYVVISTLWDSGAVDDVGAVTWANGATGLSGFVDDANSLVGMSHSDWVGSNGVTALPNGNYVVHSPSWDNWQVPGAPGAGAVTWGNGDTGISGLVQPMNSLVGSSNSDQVGWLKVVVLTNGNYVVPSQFWDDDIGVPDAGAATWADGDTGISGPILPSNSLVGNKPQDQVGTSVTALTNGNYVVSSIAWHNAAAAAAGAATWGNGTTGVTGVVSSDNSLVGEAAGEFVGAFVVALPNGNYVVSGPFWTGDAPAVGSVTWGDGATGVAGVVSSNNSLVGGTTQDMIGWYLEITPIPQITALPNSEYVVLSPHLDALAANSGGVSLGNRKGTTTGLVSAANTLSGHIENGGGAIVWQFNPVHEWVAVSRHAENLITIIFYAEELTVNKSGTGTGTVTSTPAAVNCGITCTVGIPTDTTVTLTATADPSSTFTGWGGDCSGTGACVVTMTQARNVTANFTIKSYALTVNTAGAGAGTVSGAPANPIPHGTVVTLNATSDAASAFTGWSGDCSGTGACVVTMTQARSVTANFAIKSYALTVNTTGSGAGAVSGAPANPILHGTVVTLAASPDATSTFTGWSGDCSGTGACVVTMTQARSVTATFNRKSYELTVNTTGTGVGTVSGAPANPIAHGTVVTLTASPNAASTFVGWSGDCSGTGACVLTMDKPKSVTATFTAGSDQGVEVTIAPAGPGGTVTVEVVADAVQSGAATMPLGTAATTTKFPIGTVLRLTAVPAQGYAFGGWGGNATGTQNPLDVTVNGPLSITAAFVSQDGSMSLFLPTISK